MPLITLAALLVAAPPAPPATIPATPAPIAPHAAGPRPEDGLVPGTVSRARTVIFAWDIVEPADYPTAALLNREQGWTTVRIFVDADGFPAACMVTRSSGSAALDEATCRLLRQRERFVPARGANNVAIPDRIPFRIHWSLPEKSPEEMAAIAASVSPAVAGTPPGASWIAGAPPGADRLQSTGRARPLLRYSDIFRPADYPPLARAAGQEGIVGYHLAIGSNGRVGACTIVHSSGAPLLDAATCRLVMARAQYEPARGPDGRTRPDVDLGRFAWRLSEPAAERQIP